MKISVILGSVLACSLVVATSAVAQPIASTTHSAAGMCRGRSAAVNACFDGNNEGWLWYNWTGSGACNSTTAPLVCGLEQTACTNVGNRKRVIVDGNCSSSMTCNVRVVNYLNGATLALYPRAVTGGPGNFDVAIDVPCTDLGVDTVAAPHNYMTVQCDVPIGCKIWGVTVQEVL